jgi:hypothetical protein
MIYGKNASLTFKLNSKFAQQIVKSLTSDVDAQWRKCVFYFKLNSKFAQMSSADRDREITRADFV